MIAVETVTSQRSHVVGQLADLGDSGWNIYIDDCRIGQVIEVFDGCADAVAMRNDQHP